MFFTKSVSHILLTFIDTVCLVNSFIFSYFAWSYNDLSRHLSKRSLTLLGLVELQSSWWWLLKNRDVVCIPGWPGLSLPATWSRGSYGIAGLPRLLPVLAISCSVLHLHTHRVWVTGCAGWLWFWLCYVFYASQYEHRLLWWLSCQPAAHCWLLCAHLSFLF